MEIILSITWFVHGQLRAVSGVKLVWQQTHSFQEEREQGPRGGKSVHGEAGWYGNGGHAKRWSWRGSDSVADDAKVGIS